MRPIRIAVIGAGVCSPDVADLAEETGRLVAQRGGIIICGGLGGVMEAAARGARSAGGLTVGILPGTDAGHANRHIQIPIVTGMGEARNILVVRSADAVIALTGKAGTLSEIAFCLKLDIPLVGLGTWMIDPVFPTVDTPADAVETAFGLCVQQCS